MESGEEPEPLSEASDTLIAALTGKVTMARFRAAVGALTATEQFKATAGMKLAVQMSDTAPIYDKQFRATVLQLLEDSKRSVVSTLSVERIGGEEAAVASKQLPGLRQALREMGEENASLKHQLAAALAADGAGAGADGVAAAVHGDSRALQDELDTARSTIDKLQAALREGESRAKTAMEQLQAERAITEQLRTQLSAAEEAKQELDYYRNLAKTASDASLALEARVKELEEVARADGHGTAALDAVASNAELTSLRSRLASSEATVDGLRTQLDEALRAKGELAVAHAADSTRIADLAALVERQQADLHDFMSSALPADERAQLTARAEAAEAAIAAAEARATGSEEEGRRISDELAEERRKREEMQQTAAERQKVLADEVHRLTADRDQLSEKHRSSEQALLSAREEADAAQQALEKATSAAAAAAAAAAAELAAAQEKADKLHERQEELQAALQQARAAAPEASAAAAGDDELLRRLKEREETLTSQLETAKGSVRSLQEQVKQDELLRGEHDELLILLAQAELEKKAMILTLRSSGEGALAEARRRFEDDLAALEEGGVV